MDANYEFDEHAFRNFVYDMPLGDKRKDLAEVVVVKCIDEIKMLPNNGFDVPTGCSKIPYQAIICIKDTLKALLKSN